MYVCVRQLSELAICRTWQFVALAFFFRLLVSLDQVAQNSADRNFFRQAVPEAEKEEEKAEEVEGKACVRT